MTSISRLQRVGSIVLAALVASALWAALPARFCKAAPAPADTKAPPGVAGVAAADADAFFAAVVRLNVTALKDARTASALGAEREGSGIVIGEDGLILTIGYLIVEADDVTVTDRSGKKSPARVVGYDHATGFGLIRTLAPFAAAPVPMGDSEQLAEREPVMIVNYGGRDEVGFAYVVARRPFTGSWEYMLDRAIFTAPPTLNWSGAALIGRDGKLLGVGSLIVREVGTGELEMPGNMFVPIDLLKPILDDLLRTGRRTGPARPWLGIAADEIQGRLFVTRVSPDGPADRAGIEAGDIVLAVGAAPVRTQAEFYREMWAAGSAGVEIALRVLQGAEVKAIRVRSIDRVEYFRTKPSL